jgi:hypothetical protein
MLRTVALISALAACGSSSSSSPDASGNGSGSGSGSGGLQLTLKNYESWCSVAIGSNATSASPSQTVNVSAGEVTLVAIPAGSAFEIGGNMWRLVDGDSGSGVTGTVSGMMSTAQITIDSNTAKCVWVCCPFASGSGCTGIANQCP